MAYFAKVVDGVVVQVVFVDNEYCGGGDFPESESIGQTHLASQGLEGEWLQTSYNRNFRGRFAGKGMIWDGVCFHFPQPAKQKGWILNQDSGDWEPPTPCPGDGYQWDAVTESWVTPEN